MMSSRFSSSSRAIASRAGPCASPQRPPIAWKSGSLAAARKPRTALTASGAPAWSLRRGGRRLVADDDLACVHAPTSSRLMISFLHSSVSRNLPSPERLPSQLPRSRMKRQRLYINIDHVATHPPSAPLRVSRSGGRRAVICEHAGADGITAHLREDRRHIQDDDIARLATSVTTVLNLEMACTDEMLAHRRATAPASGDARPRTARGDHHRRWARRLARSGRVSRRDWRGSTPPASARASSSRPIAARSTSRARWARAAVEFHTGPYAHHPGDPAMLAALQRRRRDTRRRSAWRSMRGTDSPRRTSDRSRRSRRSKS